MSYQCILVDDPQPQVRRVTRNRQEKRNALSVRDTAYGDYREREKKEQRLLNTKEGDHDQSHHRRAH